jgi:RimJ/RimL family protein N-acetyltransferase
MAIVLRDVTDRDLPIFFAQQLDPEATTMAAFPARDHEAFMEHWRLRVLGDDTVAVQTIEADGEVAGNLVSWPDGERRLIGYWLGKRFWGRGIATAALAAFLEQLAARPLHAYVAHANRGSMRVLEKCGFTRVGGDREGFVYELG